MSAAEYIAWPEDLDAFVPIAELGTGAASRIWRCFEPGSKREVAVKVLGARSGAEIEAQRREVYALSRLDHRGVVKVFDQGFANRTHWYSMELIEGESLATAMAAPFDRSQMLRHVLRLCQALAHVHGSGIVHRDLKPANVILRSDRLPVLVDFGLASWSTGRGRAERLEIGGGFSGTLAYAAPEQLRGEFIDARADLYAVGCILYELVTGCPPFEGDINEIIEGHLNGHAPAPAEIEAETPALLSELVVELLAKDPADRPGYALDLAAVLAEILGEELVASAGERSVYFYRPKFAGRGDALKALRVPLESHLGSHSECILIAGESGIGKTRLAMEFTRYATQQRSLIVISACRVTEGGSTVRAKSAPMDAWRPLLREIAHACLGGDEAVADRILGDRAAVLVEVEESLAQWVEDPAPALSGAAARERILEAFALTVQAFAEYRSLVLVIDDLQWADEMSLAGLARLLRQSGEDRSLLVVGTYRPEEAPAALVDLAEDRASELITLGPVGHAEVGAIVADMLALAEAPEILVDFVASQSEGNPFFVSEYLYEAAEEGILARSAAKGWVIDASASARDSVFGELAVPDSIRSLVARRIAHIDADSKRFAEAGAALGRAFDASIAQAMVGLSEAGSLEAVRQLMRRMVIEEVDTGGLRFCHDKLREVVYEGISSSEGVTLHARAAGLIEERYQESPSFPTHYAQIAHHYQTGGKRTEACRYHGLAGEHKYDRGAYQEARDHLRQALDLDQGLGQTTAARTRARWLRFAGSTSFALGNLEGSIQETEDALSVLGRRVPRMRGGWLAMAAVEGSKQILGRVFAGRRDQAAREDQREISIAATQLAASFYYDARLLSSMASVILGVNTAEAAMDVARQADAYSRLGYILGAARMGRLADHYFQLAHQAGRDDSNPGSLGLSLYMDGMYRLGTGEWDLAKRMGRESAALLKAIGNFQEYELGRAITGHALYYGGFVSTAREVFASIGESATQRDNQQHVGWGLFLAGRSDLALGDTATARRLLQEGYAHLRHLPDVVSLSMCEGLLAEALLLEGEYDEAGQVASKLMGRFKSGKRPAVGQCLDAYGNLATVALALHERRTTSDTRRFVNQALNELRWFAWLFPSAVPAWQRSRATFDRLRSKQASARGYASKSVHSARRLGMLYEEVRALRELELCTPAADGESVRLDLEHATERLRTRREPGPDDRDEFEN